MELRWINSLELSRKKQELDPNDSLEAVWNLVGDKGIILGSVTKHKNKNAFYTCPTARYIPAKGYVKTVEEARLIVETEIQVILEKGE